MREGWWSCGRHPFLEDEVCRIWLISALFAWKEPKLGDNDSGSAFTNHETRAKKHERNVVWWKTGGGKQGIIPAIKQHIVSYFRDPCTSICSLCALDSVSGIL